MAELEKEQSDLRIVIPISDKEQIDRYQKGLLGLLGDYSGENEPPFWCKVSHPDLRLLI